MEYDKKIDEMLEIDEASKKLLALELELSKLRDDRESVKQEQKRISDLMDKMADEYLAHGWVVTLEDEEYLELRNKLIEAEAKEEYIEGLIDTKQQEYEQSEFEFIEFAKSKGYTIVSNADFVLDVKPEFIKKAFLEHHITDLGANSRETFEKLVKLYGEDYLSNLVVSEYEENEYEDVVVYKRTIEDFISGEEDNLIGLVNDDILRRKMLASKLQRLDFYGTVDIRQYIQEYVEEASSNGVKNSVFEDEFGYVDFDDTMANFSMLPISSDKNFYLFLAKYLKEMNIPLETYADYIPQEFIDDKFGPELANVVNTGEYRYQMEFAETSERPISSELLAWLEGKEDELSAEEKTKKTIDETKALLDKQAEKTGEQK